MKDIKKMMKTTNLNVRDSLKGLPYSEILAEQARNTLPFALCVLDINSDLNTSSLIRSACTFGAEKTYIFGRRRMDRRGLVGAQNYVEIERIDGVIKDDVLDYEKFASIMKRDQYIPVFVETGGTDVQKMDWSKIPGKPCFVLGNEGLGIPNDFLTSAEYVVNIPMSRIR